MNHRPSFTSRLSLFLWFSNAFYWLTTLQMRALGMIFRPSKARDVSFSFVKDFDFPQQRLHPGNSSKHEKGKKKQIQQKNGEINTAETNGKKPRKG